MTLQTFNRLLCKRLSPALISGVAALGLASASHAASVDSFSAMFTHSSGGDENEQLAGELASQFGLTVSDMGDGQIQFAFANVGPTPSTITNIYFDTSSFVADGKEVFDTNVDHTNVDSSENIDWILSHNNSKPPDVVPPNLPDSDWGKVGDGLFALGASNSSISNGISNTGSNSFDYQVHDWASATFDLAGDPEDHVAFEDLKSWIIDDLSLPIGLHVQGIGEDEFSAQYATTPVLEDDDPVTVAIPLPAAGWAGLALMVGLAGTSYLRRNRSVATALTP